MGSPMTRNLLHWIVLLIAGAILALLQIGDGTFVQRAEARVPLFLGGAIIAVAGLLKTIAVATDPELRDEEDLESSD